MPRLRRLHFASIGHKDARLAPLTIDLSDPDGKPADSVVWLRNGGGKSSVLNLFFSVFRPSLNEFLGKSADGQSRRLADYVKASDCAFVVSEWDADDDQVGLAFAPRATRILGQVLEWRGKQISSDGSRLQRRFFAFRTDDRLTWDDLPISGVARAPVATLEEFSAWLAARRDERPAREVVIEERQANWAALLEQIGLDPELFGYQLRMNRREGAADELFRFTSARSFVEFFLELTLQTEQSNQVSATLREYRTKLSVLPARRLERDFAHAACGALGLLGDALGERESARSKVDDAELRAGRLAGGIVARCHALDGLAVESETANEVLREQRRVLENDVRRLDRWRQGLERLAIELDVQEAEAKLTSDRHARDAAKRRNTVLAACGPFRREEELRARAHALRRQLEAEEKERAPLLEELRHAGARLVDALEAAEDDARGLADKYNAEAEALRVQSDGAERRASEALRQRAAAEESAEHVTQRLAERDSARDRLTRDDLLEPREESAVAETRWDLRAKSDSSRLDALRAQMAAADERRRDALTERETVAAELGRREAEAGAAAERVVAARELRDALETNKVLCDVEETPRAEVFAHGLEGRLRDACAACDRDRLRSAVEGAEDARAHRSVQERGLLPSPLDVERVIDGLRARGIEAYAAPAYLAENLSGAIEKKRALVEADPARFFGVMVPEPRLDEAAELAAVLSDTLRAPVVLSACAVATAAPATPHVTIVPAESGAYDHQAAARAANSLDRRIGDRAKRDRTTEDRAAELRRLAGDVQRFTTEWGNGAFDRLVEQADSLGNEVARLRRRREELTATAAELDAEVRRLDVATQAVATDLEHARSALARVRTFIEDWDRHVGSWNEELQRGRAVIRDAGEAERTARADRKSADERRDSAMQRMHESTTRALALAAARVQVHHVGETGGPPVPLDAARSAYAEQLRSYERTAGDNELRGTLTATEDELQRCSIELDRVREYVDRAEISAMSMAAGERLGALQSEASEQFHSAEAELRGANDALGRARHALKQLSDRVRQADDLPAGAAPGSAADCRAEAVRVAEEADALRGRLAEVREQLVAGEARVAALQSEARSLEKDLARLTDAQIQPRPGPAAAGDAESIAAEVGAAAAGLHRAREAWRATQAAVARRADEVRQVALDARFAGHESAWKQRLLDTPDTLAGDAARWSESLAERILALDHEIESVEQDRAHVINGLLGVAEEGLASLNRAESASRLPDTLGRWAGQPFLRVSLEVPAPVDERRARLAPLVDELVEKGQVPEGLVLVQRSIDRLHGSRPMRVTILKPEASRRLDRVDVAAMSNFSGGERLTAAVLLYCTLVRLRAIARGRRSKAAGNVLILDNPIGTCSSVPLIELQRAVASAMGTQLVYTTGVDDLSALAQLPNVVRLRNVHRDRSTGDLHVTREAEGVVEGVRVGRRSGLPSQ